MTSIDIILAKVLLKLIDESGGTLHGEAAQSIYSLINSILSKYGYQLHRSHGKSVVISLTGIERTAAYDKSQEP